MKTIQKIFKNASIVGFGSITTSIITVIVSIFLVRHLGVENFGKYSFVYAYVAIFQIFIISAVDSIILTEISKQKERKNQLIDNGIILKIASSFVGMVICNIIINFLKVTTEVRFLVYVASFQLLLSYGSLYELIFRVEFKMEYAVTVSVVSKLLSAGLIILLIFLKAPLIYFILANFVIGLTISPGLINNLVLTILAKTKMHYKWKSNINFDIIKELLQKSFFLILAGFFVTLYQKIDQIILFKLMGEKILGYYVASLKILEPLNFIPSWLMVPIMPLLAEFHSISTEKFRNLFKLTLKYLILFILPIIMFISLFSSQIIEFLYGNNYLYSKEILKYLIWYILNPYYGAVITPVLIILNRKEVILISTFIQAFVNVILNLIFIPLYSGLGATFALLTSGIIGILIPFILPQTREIGAVIFNLLWKPLLSAFLMGVIIYLLKLPLFINIFIGICIYLFFSILLKSITKVEIEYLADIIYINKK